MNADDALFSQLDEEINAPQMLVISEDEDGGDVHDPSGGDLEADTRIAMLVRALIVELAPTIVEALSVLEEEEE